MKKEKNKSGRPTKFDATTVKKLEEAFALDCSVPEACFYAGITKQTYYNHVDEKAAEGTTARAYFDRFTALRNRPVLLARQSVVKSMQTNGYLALQYLERKRKAEFSTRVENTGADGSPLNNGIEVVFKSFKKEN